MGKRQTSREPHRRAPEIGKSPRHSRRGEDRHAGPEPLETLPRPAAPAGLPLTVKPSETFAFLFDEGKERESFAELVEEFLTARHIQEEKSHPPPAPQEFPPPQDELDLHLHTASQAARSIENFIQTARGRGLLSLRIITGKGLHSEGPAVLREVAESKLLELRGRRLVSGYRWERRRKEKSGSLIVYLER